MFAQGIEQPGFQSETGKRPTGHSKQGGAPMKIRLSRIAMAGLAGAASAALLFPSVAAADSELVINGGTLGFDNPNGDPTGTDWMSEDFPAVTLGASSSSEAPAELHPWAVRDARGGTAAAWALSVDLTGIPDTEAFVYLPVPIFTPSLFTNELGAGQSPAVVTGVPVVTTKVNNTGGLALGTNTGGGAGYYTIHFATPLRARVWPSATPGTYPGVWTVTLA